MKNHISSGALIWQRNVNSSGKPSDYCCIKWPWKICCSQNHWTIFGVGYSIHLSQKFCLHFFGCFVFIVRSCRHHWVNFVNKNYWVLVLSGSVEDPLDLFLWVTNILGHDVCWADWEEVGIRLSGTCFGQECLTSSWRTI